FFSSRRRHTRCLSDWSSDVCSSDLFQIGLGAALAFLGTGVGAHLPGRTMAGQRILLVTRHRIRVHTGEEIIGLVVLADVIETEEIGRASCRERVEKTVGGGRVE